MNFMLPFSLHALFPCHTLFYISFRVALFSGYTISSCTFYLLHPFILLFFMLLSNSCYSFPSSTFALMCFSTVSPNKVFISCNREVFPINLYFLNIVEISSKHCILTGRNLRSFSNQFVFS